MLGQNQQEIRNSGDQDVVLLPWDYKKEPWMLAGATSKTGYYRSKSKSMK